MKLWGQGCLLLQQTLRAGALSALSRDLAWCSKAQNLNSKAVKKCVLICPVSCVSVLCFKMFQNSLYWIVLDWQFDAIWFVHDHGLAMFGIVWLIVRYVQTEHIWAICCFTEAGSEDQRSDCGRLMFVYNACFSPSKSTESMRYHGGNRPKCCIKCSFRVMICSWKVFLSPLVPQYKMLPPLILDLSYDSTLTIKIQYEMHKHLLTFMS